MTTFISYSRVNSAFVVRLAKDLKTAGFDVWLDQLDIPKGARWDDEIEAAVEKSSTFMIVLAPESIESQNVKDELSYAIDAGKHILPVVIRPCKIPLRLRRFQYVDFTDKPYKDSLSDIKHLLSNTKQIPRVVEEKPYYEKEDSVPLAKGPLIQRDLPPEPGPFTELKPQGNSRISKFALPAILGVVAVAAIAAVVVYAGRNRAVPAASPTSFTDVPIQMEEVLTSTPVPLPLQVTDPKGITMRLVGAGEFVMGSDDGLADEQPRQTVYLDDFYIDKYEVPNALYRACVDAGACTAPTKVNSVTHVAYYSRSDFDNYPVVNIDWYMAKSFCDWRGARLPTEAEWEKAARGAEGRIYPWGDQITCSEANYSGCEGDTAAVSSFGNGMSPYGIQNMAGNVYEWVNSLYIPYPYEATDGREDLAATGDRVIRGGSWVKSNTEDELRSSRRQRANPSTATDNIGFRCVTGINNFVPVTSLETAPARNSFTATSMAATNHVRKTQEADGSISTGPVSTPVPSSIPSAGPTFAEALIAVKPTLTETEPVVAPVTPKEEIATVTKDTGGGGEVTPDTGGGGGEVTPDTGGGGGGATPDTGGGGEPTADTGGGGGGGGEPTADTGGGGGGGGEPTPDTSGG